MTYLIDTQDRSYPMPAKLQEWASASAPSSIRTSSGDRFDMAFWQQIMFVRDQLPKALRIDHSHRQEAISVVSTHVSHSCLLPVYRIDTGYGLVLTLRDNHFDWKVSVESRAPVRADFSGLFTQQDINQVYCEGFDPAWVYAPYLPGSRQFTVEIQGDYALWTFCHILAAALGQV